MTAARRHPPGPPTGSRSLTARQRAFVAAYARDSGRAGAAAAAREAGYQTSRAHVRGHRLLRSDYVLAAIEHQPGGRAALERLAATTRSRHIRGLAYFMLSDDNGTTVVTNSPGHVLVLFDRSARAARRYALAMQSRGDEQDPTGDPAPAGNPSPVGEDASRSNTAEESSAKPARFQGENRDRSR